MLYSVKKNNNKKNVRGGGGGGGGGGGSAGGGKGVARPRIKNAKSPNGTETNQLTIYKRGRGFSRVIQILIR